MSTAERSAPPGRSTEPDAVLERTRALLGPDRVDIYLDVPVARPSDTAHVAALMRIAGEQRWRVRPLGRGLDPRDGRRSAPDVWISSADLRGTFEHEPVDLNVRSGSGISLSDLTKRVSEERQWLALDPPGGPEITAGGVVATGVAGPLRALYGRPRDQVLGLTLVDGSGRVLSLGGRVVKNVAGFDLVRLAVGSRGALGMITDVTFRLYPRPEDDRTLVWLLDDVGEAWRLSRALAARPVPVAAAELLTGEWSENVPSAPARIIVRLTGSNAANDRMAAELSSSTRRPDRILRRSESAALFEEISKVLGCAQAPYWVRLRPSDGGPVVPVLAARSERLALHLLDGDGRGSFTEGVTAAAVLTARDQVELAGGHLRLLAEAPTEPDGPLARVRAEIVRVFDPVGVLGGA